MARRTRGSSGRGGSGPSSPASAAAGDGSVPGGLSYKRSLIASA